MLGAEGPGASTSIPLRPEEWKFPRNRGIEVRGAFRFPRLFGFPERNQIANGEVAAASKWSAIRAAFSKVGGFAKAIAGKYSDFKKWYDGLSWWVRAPLVAVSPGLTLLEIYNALH
ncbi:hypothetical protein ACGFR6_12175 [Streptomyces sp. NPDC048567]|uniref:hypothetical protein n=1 Tax=Streptomyces sp. NPDC048567 TaxID=3365570 RepID=UPI00371E6D09